MTYLDTDKQTQADLSITEGIYDEYPLYSLFSGTETKKRKTHDARLDYLSPERYICHTKKTRSDSLERVTRTSLDEEELDFIEYYLEYRDQIRRPNILVSLTSAFDRLLRHDAQRYIIRRGVTLIILLLNRLDTLRESTLENAPLLLKELAQSIQDTIHGSELKEVIGLYKDKEKSPSNYTIDKYDYLFRCIHFELIRGLLSQIYMLDVCRTAQHVAINRGFCCCPEMTDTMDLSITGFVHPFTKEGRSNDWKMSNGNICILTGSNMAGKSTTLKAITITVWLAHCGLPVPARSMICPVFDGIYTSINLPDSLRDGRSHFMAEILRIKEVLQKATSGKRCLIILDEMFRGTNAQDAFEASVAVNELLKKYLHCSFLISTHILEYAKHFEKDSACSFYYMDSRIQNDQFICPYQLIEGISEAQVGYWLVRKELESLHY